ncbi:MAG TPA: HU family DNA-binding protein, partial [Anaerolineales bacterium]|nr:HU family DNA-binding protein [Anaerolineales bacterium]
MADNKKMTKSEFVAAVAEKSGLSKKQVAAALEALNEVVKGQIGKKGPGEVIIPGLLKVVVANRPAVPAGERLDPFTKQMKFFQA